MRQDAHLHRRRGRRRASPATPRSPPSSTEVCPVDIYRGRATAALEIVEDNLDECVLCGLCLDAAPQGTVKVLKLYDDGAAL